MDNKTLKSLKEEQSKFYMLYNRLNRAKNQKERKEITKELDWLKSKMIKDFNLMKYEPQINHYRYDDEYFKGDVETIISNLKS